MNNLFTTEDDRRTTQLAYKVRCYPWYDLPDSGKDLVSWRRFTHLRKSELEARLNPELTTFYYRGREYHIVWTYNNIPTFLEWERKSDDYLISIDIRFSPAIKELGVAIFSF